MRAYDSDFFAILEKSLYLFVRLAENGVNTLYEYSCASLLYLNIFVVARIY